jgi:hypothetical protein
MCGVAVIVDVFRNHYLACAVAGAFGAAGGVAAVRENAERGALLTNPRPTVRSRIPASPPSRPAQRWRFGGVNVACSSLRPGRFSSRRAPWVVPNVVADPSRNGNPGRNRQPYRCEPVGPLTHQERYDESVFGCCVKNKLDPVK